MFCGCGRNEETDGITKTHYFVRVPALLREVEKSLHFKMQLSLKWRVLYYLVKIYKIVYI